MDNIKSGWLWLAGITMAAALVPASTPAASFDCSRASAAHELAICSDPGLSQQDEVLATLYKQALAVTDDKDGLRERQRAWIERTRDCGSDAQCLSGNYDIRYEELLDITNPQAEESETQTGDELAPGSVSLQVSPADEAKSPLVEVAPVEAPPQDQKPVSQGGSKSNPMAAALIAGIALALLFVVVGAVVATTKLARHASEKYGWNMILNWWNLLYVVATVGAFIGGWMAVDFGPTTSVLTGFLVFCGVWAVILVINVRRTSLGTGLAITLVQPFILLLAFFLFKLSQVPKPRTVSH